MKKILLALAALVMVFGWTSCGGDDYKSFVGTWGADRIDYYNIDYAGQPIPYTVETYYFTPGDPDNGIDLVFRDNRTGEMRDRSRDTLFVPVYMNGVKVDTVAVFSPDTTVVTTFTYSYHNDDALLYMNMEPVVRYYIREKVDDNTYVDKLEERYNPYTYKMQIELLTSESFIYINEYKPNYVEKARLIRISNDARSARSSKPVAIPHKPGSLFGNY